MKPAIVILAAGSGSRFGNSTNKVWLPLAGKTLICHTINNAHQAFPDAPLLLMINPDEEHKAREVIQNELPDLKIDFAFGGSTRHGSEYKALLQLKSQIESDSIDVVLIHDGARPLATPNLYKKIAEVALSKGGAIPTTQINPLEIDFDRNVKVVRVQTPQGFRAKELLKAYEAADVDGFVGTDTGACVEQYFPEIRAIAVEAEPTNLKVTYPQDLKLAEDLISNV